MPLNLRQIQITFLANQLSAGLTKTMRILGSLHARLCLLAPLASYWFVLRSIMHQTTNLLVHGYLGADWACSGALSLILGGETQRVGSTLYRTRAGHRSHSHRTPARQGAGGQAASLAQYEPVSFIVPS